MVRLTLALGLVLASAAAASAADVGRHSAPSPKYFAENYQGNSDSHYVAHGMNANTMVGLGHHHARYSGYAQTQCYDCNCPHPIFRTKASGLQIGPAFHYHRGFRRYKHGNHCCGDMWSGYCGHGPHADLGLLSGGRPHGRTACYGGKCFGGNHVRGFRGNHNGCATCGGHACGGHGCGHGYGGHGHSGFGYGEVPGPMYYEVEPTHDAQEVEPIIETPEPPVRETRRLLVIPVSMSRNPNN